MPLAIALELLEVGLPRHSLGLANRLKHILEQSIHASSSDRARTQITVFLRWGTQMKRIFFYIVFVDGLHDGLS